MSNHVLLRNAKVDVTRIIGENGAVSAEIVVNDHFQHRFSSKSRISKHLELMSPVDLSERLTGGSFFFVQDQLVDFRDGHYDGFVHNDQTIEKFMDLIGFERKQDLKGWRRRSIATENDNMVDVTNQNPIVLRKQWSNHNISVPEYKQGGEFETSLSYVWNPFVKTINSSFDLVRLICTNGAVGLTSFLNTKIPLFNRWEEHLNIASRQIQNKINDTVVAQVRALATQRATVGDCMLLEQHAFDRLYSPQVRDAEERRTLTTLMNVLNTRQHLSGVYKEAVFTNKDLASQLPAHLTNLDIYNIATELRSHTTEAKKSTSVALDRFSNRLMFDNGEITHSRSTKQTNGEMAAFSDAETAFFGKLTI